jgi:hypothetical protein
MRLQISRELLLIHTHSLIEICGLSPDLQYLGVFLEFHQFYRLEGVKTRFTGFTDSVIQPRKAESHKWEGSGRSGCYDKWQPAFSRKNGPNGQ